MIRFKLYILVLLIALTGCGESSKKILVSSESKFGGTYTKAFSDSYIVLDPAKIRDSDSHEVTRQIYDGLVEIDYNAKVVPAIAKSWSISEDKLTYTFMLDPKCHFHKTVGGKETVNGGRKVCANDVSYTLHRLIKNPKEMHGSLFFVIKGSQAFSEGKSESVSGIRIIASDTIEFELDKPFSPFLSVLATCNAFIIPKEDMEAGGGFDREHFPVGTGAFKWESSDNKKITLVANEDYFRGRAFLDKIEFIAIAGASERLEQFKNGKLMQVRVPDSEYMNVKRNPKLATGWIEKSIWSVNYLGFNVEQKPFDNVKVRQALNYAIDKTSIVDLVMNNRVKVARGILPPGMLGHNDKLSQYEYNIKKAAKLLAEAGYPLGKGLPDITLTFNKNEIHERVCQFVIANLKDIGVNCKAEELDFDEYLAKVEKGASFFRMGWSVDYPDPDNFLHTLFHSDNIEASHNYSRYRNDKVDQLLEQARFETMDKERINLYQKAERIIVDEAPWVFLYFYKTSLLHHGFVHGIQLGNMGSAFMQYRNIWIDKKKIELKN